MNRILFTLMAALMACSSAWAQTKLSKEAGAAIEKRFPGAKPEVVSDSEVNGIRLYHVNVNSPQAQGEAIVTEGGDFLSAPAPGYDVERLPAPVRNMLDALFQGKPEKLDRFAATTYRVHLMLGSHPYLIRMDALGRIREIGEDEPAEAKQGEKLDSKDLESLMPRIQRYFQQPEVVSATTYPGGGGFYSIHLKADKDRKDIVVVMNKDKDVDHWRTTVAQDQLPKQIRETLQGLFGKAKVTLVERNEQTYYQASSMARGNSLMIRVSPAGEVLTVRNADVEAENEPAGRAKAVREPKPR